MSSHSNWHRKWLNSNWTVKLFYKDNRFFCEKAPVWTSGLHHGLKQKQKADYGISSKSKTKRLIFLGKFRTISHYMCCTLSMLQMVFPHIPFIYIVVLFGSDRSVYFQLHLHLRWWLCGLKGSVDITFKAWSSVLPLSQEMSVSHGLCLLQEKQQATWESAGSHDLYQRFLWTNQAESLTYGGDGHMLRCFAKPRPALVPVHSNPKLSFKVDRAVWNVKVLSRCLIINPNCRVNEKHGLIFFLVRWELLHVWNATDTTPIDQVAVYTSGPAFLSVKLEQNNARVSHGLSQKRHRRSLAFTCFCVFLKPQTRHLNSRCTMQGRLGENIELLDIQVADILSLLESHSSLV